MIEIKTIWVEYSVTVTQKLQGWDVRRNDGVWKMAPVRW